MKRIAHRKIISVAAILGAVSLTLAGCSTTAGGGGGELDKTAPVTLTWWTGQSSQAEVLLEKMAKEFQTAHPNVKINVSSGAPTTTDLLQKMQASFVSGDTPDISYAYGYWGGYLAPSGHMLDITDKVKEPDVHWDALPEAARKIAAPDGKVIGMPALVDVVSLMYNKTLFDEANLEYPTDDWTWDQFREAAKALTNAQTGTFGYGYPVNPADAGYRFFPQFWQGGGALLNKDQTKTELDSPAGVKVLDLMNAMAVEDKSVYLDQTASKFEPLFVSGSIAMILDGPWLLADLQTAGTNYGVANLPGTDGNHTTISGPDLWVLFDNHDANRAYWSYELIKWLTSPEQDAKFNVTLGNLPLRPSLENDLPEYKKAVEDFPGYASMAANLANVDQALPVIKAFPVMSDAVGAAVSQSMQGQGTSLSNLQAAVETTNTALAK